MKKLFSNSGSTLLEGIAGMAIVSIASLILAGGIVAGTGFVSKAYALENNLSAAQAALEARIDSGAADGSVTVSYTGGSRSFDVVREQLNDSGAYLTYYRG